MPTKFRHVAVHSYRVLYQAYGQNSDKGDMLMPFKALSAARGFSARIYGQM